MNSEGRFTSSLKLAVEGGIRQKHFIIGGLLISLLLLEGHPGLAGGIEGFTNRSLFCAYYGDWNQALINRAKSYQLVILHPHSNINRKWVRELQKEGVKVVGYLSVGEDDTLHAREFTGGNPGPDGTHANWYYYDEKAKVRGNPRWNSYYVKVSNPFWKKALREFANRKGEGWYGYKYILNTLGCDGLFLDTLDTVSPWMPFPSYREIPDMAELIASIRREIGEKKILIINRGLFFWDDTLPYVNKKIQNMVRKAINGVMYENYFHDEDRLYWAGKVNLQARKEDGFSVLALDYGVSSHIFCPATIVDQGWSSYLGDVSLSDGIHKEVKKWVETHHPPEASNPPRFIRKSRSSAGGKR